MFKMFFNPIGLNQMKQALVCLLIVQALTSHHHVGECNTLGSVVVSDWAHDPLMRPKAVDHLDPQASTDSLEQRLAALLKETSIEPGDIAPANAVSAYVGSGTIQSVKNKCSRAASQIVDRLTNNYFALMVRYFKWYSDYKSLYESSRGALIEPGKLVKSEFAKIDQKLIDKKIAQAFQQAEIMGKIDMAALANKIETTDYLYESIKQLVEHLESVLNEIAPLTDDYDSDEEDYDDGDELDLMRDLEHANTTKLQRVAGPLEAGTLQLASDEQVRRTFARMKRILNKVAVGFINSELIIISRIAILNAVATYLTANMDNPLNTLIPFMRLLGAVNTPLLSSYMFNVKIRTFFSLFDSCNPVPTLVTSLTRNLGK